MGQDGVDEGENDLDADNIVEGKRGSKEASQSKKRKHDEDVEEVKYDPTAKEERNADDDNFLDDEDDENFEYSIFYSMN